MSVVGMGTDLVKIGRIRTALERHGAQRFMQRILTAPEMEYASRVHGMSPSALASHVAGRFAGKEAVFKCICPLGRRLGWREFAIIDGGQTGPQLRGRLPEGIQVHVSISHDGEYALATAVALRSPLGPSPLAVR